MMIKTKVFIAKTMAKRFYGDAMKSMKDLSGKKIAKFSKAKAKAFGKTPFAKSAVKFGKKTDSKIAQGLTKVGEGYTKLRSKVKGTGTYKDIRSIAKKSPITFGEGATAFTVGAGIGGIASKAYDSATGYERKRVKKNRKV
jgi:hypothetical protein